jgi:hypothetical protein
MRGTKGKVLRLIVVGVILAALSFVYVRVVHPKDLYADFLPAARALLSLRNPYKHSKLYYPPWILVPLVPLAIFPDRVAGALWFLLGMVAFLYTTHRIGLSHVGKVCFLLSPPVVFCLALGNVDWMPLLGLCVPWPWNVLLFLTKPQIGLGWALVAFYRRSPLSAYVLAGVVSVVAVAMALTGNRVVDFHWNVPLGPDVITVAIGVYLAFHMEDRYAPWVGPLLSPYLSFGSYAGIFLALANDWVGVLAVLLSWFILLYRTLT